MVKTATFFDIDGTLVRDASTQYLARDLFSRGYFGLDFFFFAVWQSLLYMVFGENKHHLAMVKERSLRVLKGKLGSDLILVGEELYDRFLQERLFPGTLETVQRCLDAGHKAWLVSTTPRKISQQMAYRLELTGGLGTIVEVDENGRYAGKIPRSLLHGAMKTQVVRDLAGERRLDLSSYYVYSDSMSDKKLFNPVSRPCVVNPEWKLRNLAEHHHWPIYNFARRHPSVAPAVRTTLLPTTVVGSMWTAKMLQRRVLKRLFQISVQVWRRRRESQADYKGFLVGGFYAHYFSSCHMTR